MSSDADPESTGQVSQAGSSFQGYLHKKSPKRVLGKRPWQRRYFVLEDGALSYYRDKAAWASGGAAIGVVRVDMLRDLSTPAHSSHAAQ